MERKPLFLISNDDGLGVPGLNCLIEMVRPLGDVMVVVPDHERSGASTSFTNFVPISSSLVRQEEGLTVYTCSGTPVDCVKLAVNQLCVERLPDLVVTGINHGFNASVAVHYSGTLGAAMEACISGIPSIGFSIDTHSRQVDFAPYLPYLEKIVAGVLRDGLPEDVFLNVNLPYEALLRGIRVCRQGRGRWVDELENCHHPFKHHLFWLTGRFVNLEPEADNDLTALREGYIALVPEQLDMTSERMLDRLRSWDL